MMQQGNVSDDAVSILRSKKHVDMQNQREKSRENILLHNRMKVLETQIGNNVTLNEVKGLILELSQKEKKLDKDILKKIKNSCCRTEFIEAFFKINGAFDALVCCLKRRDAGIKLEVLACFTNLACGSHKFCFRVAKAVGAYLVSFISGNSHHLQAQCAWAVRNIANDCLECYSKLKAQGVFPALLKALMSPMPDVTESVIYALNACLKYEDLDLAGINKEEYTSYLLKLIKAQSFPQNTIREIAFVLSHGLYIIVGTNHHCDDFNIKELLECLKEFIFNENNDYLTALILIRCLGYLTVNERMVQYLFTSILFQDIVVKVLNHSSHFLKKELFWVITNISVSCVIDTDHSLFIPILKTLEIFLNPLDSAVSTVLYYICCTATQSENIRSSYQQEGLITRIEDLAKCGDSSVENFSNICLTIIQN